MPQKGLPGQDPSKEIITKLRTWDVLLSNFSLGDVVTPCKIGDCPRDLEDTMERPRRKLQLLHRGSHE